MKVLHIHTYGNNGGAGRACLRLNAALNGAGIRSHVLNLRGAATAESTPFAASPFLNMLAIGSIMAERQYSGFLCKVPGIPFSAGEFGFDISRHELVREADILHLHWINHGFLTPRFAGRLARLGKPVVWTLHDSNTFTGGCHVRYDCAGFKERCGSCPVLGSRKEVDHSRTTWLRKQKHYAGLRPHIICPSQWMLKSVKESSLLAFAPAIRIPNAIDTGIFKPMDKGAARARLGIPGDKLVLLSGYMPSSNDMHKGSRYMAEALRLLAARGVPADRVILPLFGPEPKSGNDLPFEIKPLGTIRNDAELAAVYSAADAFLCTSIEDNLPNTVMESLACGTPVIGFNTGGVPDMVQHMYNGYIAAFKDSTGIADGIAWLMELADRTPLNNAARDSAVSRYAYSVIGAAHKQFYDKILGQYGADDV